MHAQTIKQHFPIFDQSELVRELLERSQYVDLPANQTILEAGHIISNIPLVFSGAIKVIREDDTGNEIFLYYIRGGQSCAMTITACLKREKSVVKAITQTETKALIVPLDVVHDFLFRYPSWSKFVVDTYSRRFEEIIEVVDSVAFQNMDARLLKYLLEKSRLLKTNKLVISNTEIAKDLNSSREVIFRLLKQLEQRKVLIAARGKIELLDL